MSALGLNLLLALALLAPGFAVYMALFTSGRSAVRAAPPAPNSVAALGVVTIGAMAVHVIGALLFSINDALVAMTGPLVAFEADPYRLILPRTPSSSLTPVEARWLLSCDLLACVGGYGLTRLIFEISALRTWVAKHLLGWAGALPPAAEATQFLTAFVLTDVQLGETQVGYEGAIADLSLTSDKAVASILLVEVRLFHMVRQEDRIVRVEDARDVAIPHLLIEGEHINNIAFDLYDLSET